MLPSSNRNNKDGATTSTLFDRVSGRRSRSELEMPSGVTSRSGLQVTPLVAAPAVSLRQNNDSARVTPSAPRSPKKPLDPWVADRNLALLHGLSAGFAVPLVTTPLIQVEANITGKHMSLMQAIMASANKPWKGYAVLALTNTARCGLLFGATPWTKDYLIEQGMTPTNAKIAAFGFVGCFEGIAMSARFPLMQILHTSDVKNSREALKQTPRAEIMQRWGVSCRYGVVRDVLFWPIYAGLVDTMEEQLLVYKQKETAAKWEEEFMIGATAGFIGSLFSFPVHGVLRRRLENLDVTVKQDFVQAWDVHSQKPNSGWSFIRGHVYKGYGAAAVIMPVTMGMMNLAKHAADVLYNSYLNKTGFFRQRTPAEVERLDQGSLALLKLGSP